MLIETGNIVASLIAVIGVFFTARVALQNNNKNLLIKTVTDERATWRKELRNTCAEFSKLIYEQINNSSINNKPRINELKVHLKLRVNPNPGEKHLLDQSIITISQELVVLLDSGHSKEDILNKLVQLENTVQQLLKQEWDKSKLEAVTGKLGN